MKKQILACVLVVTMLISTFVVNASAQKIDTSTVSETTTVVQSGEPLIDGDFEYTTNEEGTVEITKYTGTGGDVVIPSIIEGKNVTQIGQYSFENCTGLTSITIPDTVTTIWWNAFEGCTGLSNVTLPNSVTAIHRSAFRGCIGLSSIKIPASVTSINERIFYGCTNLSEIKVSVDNPVFADYDGIICDKAIKTVLCCPEGKKGEIKLPDSVTKIDDNAFDSCLGLNSITIPASVTQIGNAAFYDCNNLADVYYSGDKKSWEKISIDTGNDPLLKAKLHVENINKPYATIHGFELIYGLGCGESKTFTVRFNFNTDITSENYNFVYTSSNNSIATIHETKHDRISNYSVLSEVEVTGVSGGTAKLTVKETTTGSEESFDISVFNGSDFKLNEDNLSFSNSAENFYDDWNRGWFLPAEKIETLPGLENLFSNKHLNISYQLSDDVYERLLSHACDNTESEKIKDKYNSIWQGSCYGMCDVMDITFTNPSNLPISRVFSDNKFNDNTKLYELPKPIKQSEMEDLVNYYHLTQYFNFYENITARQFREISNDYSNALKKLVNSINDTSTPVSAAICSMTNTRIIGWGWEQKGGHRILLLRIKEETNDCYIIECYDPNKTNSFTELKLYKYAGNYKGGFNISYDTDSTKNTLYRYLDNAEDIDHFNFFSTKNNDSETLKNDIVKLFYNSNNIENNFAIISDGNILIENGESNSDSVIGPVPTNDGIDVSNGTISEFTYYIDKEIAKKYTVTSESSAQCGKAEITLGNHMFSIITKDSGTTTFDDNTGEITVVMDNKSDYVVRVTDNDNICNWDWFTLTINANDSKTLDVQFTDTGVLISGDNLKGTEVTVNNISDDSTLTIDESLTSVMIQNNGKEITATEVKQNINNTQNSNTSTNTNTTANNNGSTNSSTESVSNVTTGDATKVSLIAFIFTVSAVTMTISIKRKKRN